MTLTQGVSPSVCTIEVPPLKYNLPSVASLLWSYGGGVGILFPDCAIDKIEPRGDSSGRVTWRITILDRRWIWRETGAISGRYNTERDRVAAGQGGPAVKTLRELMRLCLDAMGEQGAIVSGDINQGDTFYPEVDWDFTRPAEALADLCDRSNNIVTLGLDNRVRIFARGTGANLPTAKLIETQTTIDPPEAPAKVVVVGAPDQWQADFILDPVGQDVDGTIKPIDELSYAPQVDGAVDWSENDFELHSRVEAKFRPLAKGTVWKWYRIRPGIVLPGDEQIQINDLREILPLLNQQVETYENEDGVRVARPPWVFGKFSPLEDRLASKDEVEPRISNQPDGLYTGPFDVDLERGIVKFQSPVVLLEKTKRSGSDSTASGLYAYPPDIRLRIAVNYREDVYKGIRRTKYFDDRTAGSSNLDQWTRFVLDESLTRGIYFDAEAGELVDNRDQLEPQALLAWQTVISEYQSQSRAESSSYAGLVQIPCDGAIAQVTWQIGNDGKVTTRASRNREELFITASYRERRLAEKISEQLRVRK